MKLAIFMFLSGFLLASEARCQKLRLKRDPFFKYANVAFCDSIGVKKPNFKKLDIEVRVWKTTWISGERLLFRFQGFKRGKWQVKKYSFMYYNNSNYDFCGVDSCWRLPIEWWADWNRVIYNNYLNTRTQKEVNSELNLQLYIADGETYLVEVLTRRRKRSFRYDNPREYCRQILEDNRRSLDYEQFMALIEMLNTYIQVEN